MSLTKLMMASATIVTLVSNANAAADRLTGADGTPADAKVSVTVPLSDSTTDSSKLGHCMFRTQTERNAFGWVMRSPPIVEHPQYKMNECIQTPGNDKHKAPFMIAECTGDNEVTFRHFKEMDKNGKCLQRWQIAEYDENVEEDVYSSYIYVDEVQKAFKSGESIYSEYLGIWNLKVFVNCEKKCEAPSVVNAKEHAVLTNEEPAVQPTKKEPAALKNEEPAAPTKEEPAAPTKDEPVVPPTKEEPAVSEELPKKEEPAVSEEEPSTKKEPTATDPQAQNNDNSGGNSKSAMGVLFAGLLVFLGMNA